MGWQPVERQDRVQPGRRDLHHRQGHRHQQGPDGGRHRSSSSPAPAPSTSPPQTINYRLNAKVASKNGKLQDFAAPVLITGPLGKPKIYPDVQGILQNPQGALEQIETIGGDLFGLGGNKDQGRRNQGGGQGGGGKKKAAGQPTPADDGKGGKKKNKKKDDNNAAAQRRGPDQRRPRPMRWRDVNCAAGPARLWSRDEPDRTTRPRRPRPAPLSRRRLPGADRRAPSSAAPSPASTSRSTSSSTGASSARRPMSTPPRSLSRHRPGKAT